MPEQKFKIGQLYDPALKTMTEQERKDNLTGISTETKVIDYTVQLTPEEIAQRERQHSQNHIELGKLAQAKADYIAENKKAMKPLQDSNKELITAIQYGSEQRTGTVYLIPDYDQNMGYLFDINGYCVDVRALTREERQMRIIPQQSGTNG